MAEVVEKSKSRKTSKPKFSKKTYIEWYTMMLRIRRFEEATLKAYGQQKVRGFCHVYIGQEAIAAGLISAIKPEDGIVQIPIGTGIAFAEKYRETKNLCVTMFGDGAARQGALYESFNMAMTWKLPVLYICENNHYAMGTSVSRTSNIKDIYKVGHAFDMPSEAVDGMSPESVHLALEKAAKHIRAGKGPYFLEIKTYRYKGHSVSDPAKYRTKEELKSYQDQDPVKMTEAKILKEKIATEAEIQKIKDAIKAEIAEAVAFAESSPYPDGSTLFEDNYLQEDYPFITD